MFLILVFPIESTHMHNSWVIRMTISKSASKPIIMEIMRIPCSFCILHASNLFQYTSTNSIFHSHSCLFIILKRNSSPIIRPHISVIEMTCINYSIPYNPHTKPTIRVNRILLCISVHFICMVKRETMRYIHFGVGTDPIGELRGFDEDSNGYC